MANANISTMAYRRDVAPLRAYPALLVSVLLLLSGVIATSVPDNFAFNSVIELGLHGVSPPSRVWHTCNIVVRPPIFDLLCALHLPRRLRIY